MSGDSVETKQILSLIAHGDRKAFDTFYHLYYNRVFRTAYYVTGNTDSCREVVSDVFFSIWRMGKRLGSIANIESYLYIATKNEANRRLQNDETLRQQQVSLSEVSLSDIEAPSSPESQLETSEMRAALSDAIDALPEKCRIIFLMSREEGMDSRHIADCLGISDSTVRVQLKIAVERIVERLKKTLPYIPFSLILAIL